MELGPVHYAVIFAGSAFLCWAFTPVALRLAVRAGILDRPASYKAQPQPMPYLGGAAIVTAFGVAVLLGALLVRPGAGLEEFPLIMLLALGLAVVGLVDDVRGVNVLVRFMLEVAAGVVLWSVGVQITILDIPALDAPLTVIWIVGITNAFNLLDNMDGLSAGIAALASGAFFIIAAMNGQFLVAALSAGLAGCALGFLRHNFHPANIYMGDAGSLFIGFLLAVIGVKLEFEGPVEVTFMVPILVLGVPILDTIVVVASRLLNRLNPLSGGRDHISHRLVFVGLPVRGAVGTIYGAGAALGWIAVAVSRVDMGTALVLMALVLVLGTLSGIALGLVPVYRHNRRGWMMLRRVEPYEDPADLRQPGEPAPVRGVPDEEQMGF